MLYVVTLVKMSAEGLSSEDFTDISIDEENSGRFVFTSDELWVEITKASIAVSSMKKIK